MSRMGRGPEGRRRHGRPWRRWEDNIDVNVKQLGMMLWNVFSQISHD
jgi:hypothetical protein